jgi:hypothetical protein
VVNLTTGAVGEIPKAESVETPELAQLRTSLFALRAEQRISPSEAMCLINQIRHLGALDACSSVRIVRVEDDFVYGTIEAECLNQEHRVIHVIVNRNTGELKDEDTREVFASPGIEGLRSAILAAHSPAKLTVDQAMRLVETGPVVAQVVRGGWLADDRCADATVESLGNADEDWFQLTTGCAGQANQIARLSVNIVDGTIRVIEPDAAIASPAIQETRETALAQARSIKASASQTLQKECPGRQ